MSRQRAQQVRASELIASPALREALALMAHEVPELRSWLMMTPGEVAVLLGKSKHATSRIIRALCGGEVDGRRYMATLDRRFVQQGEPRRVPARFIRPIGIVNGVPEVLDGRDPDQPFRRGEVVGFAFTDAGGPRDTVRAPGLPGQVVGRPMSVKIWKAVELVTVDKDLAAARLTSRTANREKARAAARTVAHHDGCVKNPNYKYQEEGQAGTGPAALDLSRAGSLVETLESGHAPDGSAASIGSAAGAVALEPRAAVTGQSAARKLAADACVPVEAPCGTRCECGSRAGTKAKAASTSGRLRLFVTGAAAGGTAQRALAPVFQ